MDRTAESESHDTANQVEMHNASSPEFRLEKPYGTWTSPITSEAVTEQQIKFIGLIAERDCIFWNELREHEHGRCVICSCDGEGHIEEWTPQDYSARSKVHGHGGGDFFVYSKTVYFTNFSDQALYRQYAPLTSPEVVVDPIKKYRYADGRFCQEKRKIYCIREDFEVVKAGAKEQENTIVAIDPETKEQAVVIQGADFYSCPRVSPNGKYLVWVQWNHPNMPWDSTEVWRAQLCDTGFTVIDGSIRKVAGGKDDKGVDVSVLQPNWTIKNKLLYIGDQSNWWNLYKVKPVGLDINLRPVKAEMGGPEWRLGKSHYAQDPTGGPRIITVFDGELGVLDRKKRRYIKIDTGFSFHSQLVWSDESIVYCIAHGETHFEHILRIHADTIQVNSGCSCLCSTPSISTKLDVIRASITHCSRLGYYSIPHAIAWRTTNHEMAYGWYYPPRNKDFAPPEDELPPLLVRVHGGPTSAFSTQLNLGLQYFTSRGFAVLCIDYRGSTRYGKQYRHRLRKMWGVYDVEDCCSGAQYLVGKDLADPERLCIDGVYVGGYTTLSCLTFYNVFKAGVSISGISDLTSLTRDSNKFESHYCDFLLAPKEEGGQEMRAARSPINYPDKQKTPTAFFHGSEDEMVPPSQVQMVYEAVKENGVPTTLIMFEGESHEFHNIESFQTLIDGEFYFFSKVLGFEPANKTFQMEIVNLTVATSDEDIYEQTEGRATVSSLRSYRKKSMDVFTVQSFTK